MTMTPFAKVLDAVPVVPTTAYRNTFYPSTTTINQRVQNLETGNIERWNGSTWVTDFFGAGGTPTAGAVVLTGAGSPAGSVTGNPGWLYIQQVSATITLLWVKQSGTATTTGWIATQGTGTASPEGVLTAGLAVPFTQVDGVNGMTLWIKQTASGNTGWQLASFQDQRANAQRFLTKLVTNLEDATLLLLSDSTGGPTYWSTSFWAGLAAYYPAYTVKVYLWDTTAGAYGVASTIQTGTGAQTLSIYNFYIPGATTSTPLAPAYYSPGGGSFQTAVQVIQPDYCLISYGHNEGATPATSQLDYWVSQYLELVTALMQALPDAEFCIIAQNPEAANNYQAFRMNAYAKIAATYGMGFLNVHQAFQENGGAALLDVDGVHPNAAGVVVWTTMMLRCYRYSDTGWVGPSGLPWPSADEELLVNGDFSNYLTSPGAPTGWVIGGGATVTKDTTNFESPNGYAVQVQAVGAVAGDLQQTLDAKRLAGKWVTLLARVYVGNGQPGNAGVIGLYDGVVSSSTSVSRLSTFSQQAFRWVVWQLLVDASATTLTVLLWGDHATQNGAATFDRVSLRLGRWPIIGAKNGAVAANQIQPGTLPDGTYVLGSNTGTFNRLRLNGAAGASRILEWMTAGVTRWLFNMSGTESGSNAGASVNLQAYDDSGTLIDTVLTIIRAANGAIASARAWAMKGVGAQQSADRGDASVTLQHGVDQGVQICNTPLTAGRTYALSLTSAVNGATFDIRRTVNATGNFGIAVGSGPLVTLTVPGSWCRVGYNGSAWTLLAYGIDASVAPALSVTTAAAPAGTTSTAAFVMMGVTGSITPVRSGRVRLTISGQMANGTAGDGVSVQLRYGTGSAPTNGAALTGTQLGGTQTVTSVSAAQRSGFSISAPVAGFTLGTTYWIDAAVEAITGGTATITGVTVSAEEQP